MDRIAQESSTLTAVSWEEMGEGGNAEKGILFFFWQWGEEHAIPV